MPAGYETIGTEFQANSTTANAQSFPSVTSLADGGFLVSWTSYNQDGSGYGIYVQRYAADGTTRGDEFQVNTATASDQYLPSVTSLADGGFLVSWQSHDGQDGAYAGIYAQRYAADGTTVGGEFRVNSTTVNDEIFASATSLADGGFVISWTAYNQDGSGYGIFAQRYAADGTAAGNEFRVNSTTVSDQLKSSVTSLADGGFLVSWVSYGQYAGSPGIIAQRYAADGTAVGGEFLVNSTMASDLSGPSVTALSDGGFLVAWRGMFYGDGGDGSQSIFAQRYASDGTAMGGEFQVNTTTPPALGYKYSPSITELVDGGFLISWATSNYDGSGYGIVGQLYAADGTAVGGEFQVNSTAAGDQLNPSVTGLADGGFLVSWSSVGQDGSSNGIFGQRYVPASNGLFDGYANNVNFNALTLAQKDILASSTGDAIYESFGGNDYVTLPNLTNAVLGLNKDGQSITWDFERTFDAGAGDDSIVGGDYSDIIDGGEGNDGIDGGGGGDTLLGGAGDDTIKGGDSFDTIDGGDGFDSINGGGGDDILLGGAGIDLLIASEGDALGEYDQLDGGAGRDTFHVNKGDRIAEFALDDAHILFVTTHPVERIAIVYDDLTQTTEIRGYAADLVTYESITIEQGIRPNLLTAQFFTGDGVQGIRIENDIAARSAFEFALDAAAAQQATIDALAKALPSVPREVLKTAIDEVSGTAVQSVIERWIAGKSSSITDAQLKEVLQGSSLAVKGLDLAYGFRDVLVNYLKGKYEGKLHVMAQDIGSAITNAVFPGGAIVFRLGTEMVADLVGRVVFAMTDSLSVSYAQVKYGRTAVPTEQDDVLVIDRDGAVYTLGDGDDLIINADAPNASTDSVAKATRMFAVSGGAGLEPTISRAEAAQARTVDGGTGIDTIAYAESASVTIDLASGDATGAFGADILISIENAGGGSGADVVRGDAGANELSGNNGDDRLEGRAGDDRLDGDAGVDRLYGGEGADRLDGGTGADVMYGGTGDDRYVADDLSDAPIELLGEGTDTVLASRAHTLKANVENLAQTGIYSIHGTGNALDNEMTGNSGSNRLWGEAGNDTLIGLDGSDQLDGGSGDDVMLGGLGNDIYFVDSTADSVFEEIDYGRDTVRSSVTLTLDDNFEWLELQGTSNINGNGNELANVLRGNAGANILRGYAANDKISGREGNDVVDGGDGVDWLEGGSGRDRYYGGAGGDRFVFRDSDFSGTTTSTADQIHDFGDEEGDRIHLGVVDADTVADGNQAFSFVGTGAFTGTAGELRYEQISGNTYVQGDVDGDGIADFWVRLDGVHELGTDDFIF